MTVTAELKKNIVMPVGEYWAHLISVDLGEPGPHGELWLWKFAIAEGDFAGSEFVGISSTTYSTYPSKSYQWARALGHPADDKFNSALIQGKPCRLVLTIEEKEDGGQRNILDAKGVLRPVKDQHHTLPPETAPEPEPVPAAPVAPESGTWNEEEAVPA